MPAEYRVVTRLNNGLLPKNDPSTQYDAGCKVMITIATLDDGERRALEAALDDEYKSHAIYAQVIRDFGPIRPFINIVDAEARHASALLAVFDRYGLTAPANRWTNAVPRYSSIQAACVASIQGEIENIALYDRILASTRRSDLRTVYESLRAASQERHLPAFRRCAERGSRGGDDRAHGVDGLMGP
jgi:hypothetical protein